MEQNQIKKSKLANRASWLLFIGIVILISFPLLLKFPTVIGFLNYLSTTGQIGDTVGGITAPFLNLIGSFLVFFALKSQVHANNLLQQQIEDQKNEKKLTDEAANLNQLYLYVEEHINSFSFTSFDIGDLDLEDFTTDIEYKGGSAFRHFFLQIRCFYHGTQESLDQHQSVAEVISILTIMELLIIKLLNCRCSNREMLLTLVEHQFLYKMTTEFGNKPSEELTLTFCQVCKRDHGLPEHIRNLITNIQHHLKNVN